VLNIPKQGSQKKKIRTNIFKCKFHGYIKTIHKEKNDEIVDIRIDLPKKIKGKGKEKFVAHMKKIF